MIIVGYLLSSVGMALLVIAPLVLLAVAVAQKRGGVWHWVAGVAVVGWVAVLVCLIFWGVITG